MGVSGELALEGIRVLVTRERSQAARLVSELESLGAVVHAIPGIKTQPLPEPEGLKDSLHHIAEYDHLVFTSVNGVNYFLRQLDVRGLSASDMPSALCVGPRTADAWRKAGGVVSMVPGKYTAEDLVQSLGDDLEGISLLVLRPERVKTHLGKVLRDRGCIVDEIILYRTVAGRENAGRLVDLLKKRGIDVILFASPSAVEGILLMAGEIREIEDVLAVCIGPVTAEAAVEGGLKRVLSAEKYTVEGMVELLVAAAAEMKDRR